MHAIKSSQSTSGHARTRIIAANKYLSTKVQLLLDKKNMFVLLAMIIQTKLSERKFGVCKLQNCANKFWLAKKRHSLYYFEPFSPDTTSNSHQEQGIMRFLWTYLATFFVTLNCKVSVHSKIINVLFIFIMFHPLIV